MDHFTAHRLRFVAEVQSTIELNEHQGSALRGALFHALLARFCVNREAQECNRCPLVTTCPVAFLVSTLDPNSGRGRDVPRPFTIQPPLPGSGHPVQRGERLAFRYEPGERLEFGLTLYAHALQLFPYVILALTEWERSGLGKRVNELASQRVSESRIANRQSPIANRQSPIPRRGTFVIREIVAVNPLTGERQPVLRRGDTLVQVPDIPITHQQICEWANQRIGKSMNHVSRFTLHFLTPTRITEKKHLLKPGNFQFRPFFQRLLERLEALSRQFSDSPLVLDDPRGLIAATEGVEVMENALHWEEVWSYSTRSRGETPTSGFLGSVTLQAADWSPFLPWLVWGQFTHVGKDAVKGDGWYRVSESANQRGSELRRREGYDV